MNDTLTYRQIPGHGFFQKMQYLNSVNDYLIWGGVIIGGIIIARIIRSFINSRVKESQTDLARYYIKLESKFFPIVYLFIIYSAYHGLEKTIKMAAVGDVAFTVAFMFLLTRLVAALVSLLIYGYLAHHDTSKEKIKQIRGIVLILNGVLWILGAVLLFDNLGFNVTAILTGLGVGGIAIALAAQTILGDIFNYFVIFFDRPFEVGDFIIVDDKMGVVEYVGLKTTRLKSLSGEQIVFSNSNLTNSRVHNYKRMNERRIVFKFGVLYDTGMKKLKRIPEMVRSIIEKQSDVRLDRVHFAALGDYSIDFEVVYYTLNSDYNFYMDTQQSINYALYDEFEQAGIEFAFPTYSVNLSGKIQASRNGRETAEIEEGHKTNRN